MAEKIMDFDLAAEIVADIETRVGKFGQQSVTISKHGERFGSIALARGGIVTPSQSYQQNYEARRKDHRYTGGAKKGELMYPDASYLTQPDYNTGLAIVKNDVGAEGDEGLHAHEGVRLSNKDSHEYVFVQGENGLWRAFDAFDQSSDNYWTQTTEYFLDAARLVTTDEEGIAIRGLITSFDNGLVARAEAAVKEETGLLAPGL